MNTLYVSACLINALLAAGLAYFFVLGVKKGADAWKRVPRMRWPGAVLGALCLAWTAFQGLNMLEGKLLETLRLPILVLVPILSVSSFFFLDFLFARAIGGVMILLGQLLIMHGFAEAVPVRPLFSFLCYAEAIAGMFFIATPWRFRNLLEKATNCPKVRNACGVIFGVYAIVFAVMAFM